MWHLLTPPFRCVFGVCLGATVGSARAWANEPVGPYPSDIEMVRPSFTPFGPIGVAAPQKMVKGTWGYGMTVQWQRDPLRLYEFDELVGSVVRSRTAYHLGAVYAATDRMAVTMSLPFARNTGSDIPELAGDGWGLGDFIGGLQFRSGSISNFVLGFHGDIFLPVGSNTHYLGERGPRFRVGSNGRLDLGSVDFVSDVFLLARQPVVTEENLIVGTELGLNAGFQWDMVPDIVAIQGAILTRGSFVGLANGAGENGVEGMFGIRTTMQSGARIDLGLGKGLNEGYGTTGLRVLAGVSFVRIPKAAPLEEALKLAVPELAIEDAEPTAEEEQEWKPGELARIEEDEIVIRDPIQFEFATTNILPISLPTLQAVAALMQSNAKIGHLVIEGHASREGSFIYNYDLSMRRAEAIFREIVEAGVHPSRLSFVGFGEVDPVGVFPNAAEVAAPLTPEQQAQLAASRRVLFRIVRQYRSNETPPTYPSAIRLPWDGTTTPALLPLAPPPVTPDASGPENGENP